MTAQKSLEPVDPIYELAVQLAKSIEADAILLLVELPANLEGLRSKWASVES